MMHVDVIAVGRLRDKALLALWQDYSKRIVWPLALHEIEGKKPTDEQKKILEKLDPRAHVFVLDERGKSLPSRDFAGRLEKLSAEGITKIQFVIGGADGLDEEIRKKAHFLLSFGAQTWPHMLARVMLAEQIYRAQQILAGHPYHRD